MADKNAKSVVTIFGMLIAAGIILLAVVLSADAQDFEPDRRPEANLYLAAGWNTGSVQMLGQKQTGLNTAGTPVTFSRAFSTQGSAYYWTTDDSVYRTFPVTVCSWIRADALLNNANGRIFAHGYWNGARNVGTFTLFQDGYSKPFTANYWTSVSGTGSSAIYASASSLGGMQLGRWYHVCIVRTSTTLTMYVDGVSLGWASSGASESIACYLGIGTGWYNATGAVGDRTLQSLYDFRIYRDTALTASEVSTIYHSTKDSVP